MEFITPGEIYEVRLSMGVTSNLFKEGHSIRLDVSSSNFPRFDRNTNTGGTIATDGVAELKTATNTIYHDQVHPSHLILPVIERE